MRIRVLGCSGGIGGAHLRTTSLLVDDDILIDAGTGVGDLSIAELARIDHGERFGGCGRQGGRKHAQRAAQAAQRDPHLMDEFGGVRM